MNNELSLFKCIAYWMTIVEFLLTIGCTPKLTVFPDVPFHPVSKNRYFQEQESLMVAIEPFLEPEKNIAYFGTDLLSQGILPVFVVAENHNPKSGFLLEKTNISLLKQDVGHNESEIIATSNRQPIMPYSQEAVELRQTSHNLMVFSGIFPILVVPGMITGSQLANADSIIENLRKKALTDKTIYPGQKTSGFVYFQMNKRDEINKISAVLIRSKILHLDKELSFKFKMGDDR